jgi:excisionase family DNA binding protein
VPDAVPLTTRHRAPRAERPPARVLVDVHTFARAAGGVSERTVRRWIHDGTLPAYKLAGRGLIRIALDDLDLVIRPVKPGEVSP